MQFRPCIDIHNGKVKQIVGSTLNDASGQAKENFVSGKGADYYASLYKEYGLKGGHVILLNKRGNAGFEETEAEGLKALKAYPNGLQIGGGITDENAHTYIEAGASHVIVTSYLFDGPELSFRKMSSLVRAVGKEHIVFDLSCRRYEDGYHIMTDRWQTKTEALLDGSLLDELKDYCDEYLIHAVDVEGSSSGIETNLIESLRAFRERPITYAGGVHSYEDLEILKKIGEGRIHVTVGSALDLFGGTLEFTKVAEICKEQD